MTEKSTTYIHVCLSHNKNYRYALDEATPTTHAHPTRVERHLTKQSVLHAGLT